MTKRKIRTITATTTTTTEVDRSENNPRESEKKVSEIPPNVSTMGWFVILKNDLWNILEASPTVEKIHGYPISVAKSPILSNRQEGLFATKDISISECILRETPNFLVTMDRMKSEKHCRPKSDITYDRTYYEFILAMEILEKSGFDAANIPSIHMNGNFLTRGKESIALVQLISQEVGSSKIIKNKLTEKDIISVLDMAITNATWISTVVGGMYYGYGIYELARRLNHSCRQNAYAIFTKENEILIFPFRDIKKGEEITINYMGNTDDCCYSYRNSTILNRFGFKCRCILCTAQFEYEENIRIGTGYFSMDPILLKTTPCIHDITSICLDVPRYVSERVTPTSEDDMQIDEYRFGLNTGHDGLFSGTEEGFANISRMGVMARLNTMLRESKYLDYIDFLINRSEDVIQYLSMARSTQDWDSIIKGVILGLSPCTCKDSCCYGNRYHGNEESKVVESLTREKIENAERRKNRMKNIYPFLIKACFTFEKTMVKANRSTNMQIYPLIMGLILMCYVTSTKDPEKKQCIISLVKHAKLYTRGEQDTFLILITEKANENLHAYMKEGRRRPK